jgi:hypothetical protein
MVSFELMSSVWHPLRYRIPNVELVMLTRSILTLALVATVLPAAAGELRPEEARHFIAGKHFSYTCFDGTSGAGRINPDGSVAGTIQIRGAGPVRFASLPAGTIRVQSDSICASLRGVPFQPCFTVNQIDSKSFRGSISGLGFAYCDFTRHNPRLEISAPSHSSDEPVMRASISE